MLLHDNYIPFFVNLQAVVVFHYKVKCTNCILYVQCISIMADSDKTLIEDGNLSNKNRNNSVPNIVPPSSGTVHPDTHPIHHVAVSEPSTLKRKQTSFQITSVTVKGSRLSTDGGEDSADDLDESHTEDASSDILDCSRTTDVDNDQLSEDNSNANNDDVSTTAPSIPSKCRTELSIKHDTQGKVAIKVPSESSKTEKHSAPCEIIESEHIVKPPTLPDQWQHRFRVVKIVSSEPFKKGRWLCMDFMDPPAPAMDAKAEGSELIAGTNTQLISDACFSDVVTSDHVAHIYEISPSDAYPGSISVAVGPDQVQQPMYGIFLSVNKEQYPFITSLHSVTVPILKQDKKKDPPPSVSSQSDQQSQSASTSQSTVTCQPAQGLQNVGPQEPQKSSQPTTNIQASTEQESQSVKSLTPPTSSQAPVSSAPTAQQSVSNSLATVPQPQLPTQSQVTQDSQFAVQQPQIQTSVSPLQSHALPVSTTQAQTVSKPILVSSTSQINDESETPVFTDSSTESPVQQPSDVTTAQTSNVGTQASAVSNIPEVSTVVSAKEPETVTVPSQVIQNHIESKELGTPPSTNLQVAQEVLADAASVKSDINGEDSESVPSGTSTVAIDNKIEQAMDLVKSHLMFAVREEVDVLKEKITELMDRISQLEYENGFLKANASQETLEQLNQAQLLQQQQQNQPSTVSINSLPQVTQQSLQQQQLNIENQQSTS